MNTQCGLLLAHHSETKTYAFSISLCFNARSSQGGCFYEKVTTSSNNLAECYLVKHSGSLRSFQSLREC
jgi:hypothetical protein